ncbi:hypothetical protein [Nonlabens antarcticus]|uniref:hypothetical protein n=1 Tax=Nonlabens antarcticus TaxID=392714 RepID=UPI00189118D3|nr:hypothetical protein [Nonlabens antarcticus]
MYNILQSAHSGWAYLLVLVLFIATVNAVIGFFTKREFGNRDFSLALIGLIVTHIQLLIGIILYLTPQNLARWEGFEMSNSATRLLIIEHPLMMIIAVALLTIGYSKSKKKIVSRGKFKMLSIFYTLAFLVILSRLPWSQWL